MNSHMAAAAFGRDCYMGGRGKFVSGIIPYTK